MVNAISVDLEDWYHIGGFDNATIQKNWQSYSSRLENNTDKILTIFKQYNVRATFFIVGIIAKNNPELIRAIVSAGHEVATHGFSHRRIFDMTPDEFEHDLLQSKEVIEKVTGREVLGYRAPEWSLKSSNIWALDILKKHGFRYDASAVPLSHLGGKYFGIYPYKFQTKLGDIIEFPLSTFRCFWERLPFSGGLPMRINPYFHILDNIKSINKLGYPTLFYLHPWEFDEQRLEVNLPINRKFMHNCNLTSTPKKIKLLLERISFSAIEDVLRLRNPEITNYSHVPKYNKIYDFNYLKSTISTLFFIGSLILIIIFAAFLMKEYSFLLIITMLTIFYWPWGSLINKVGFLLKKFNTK